jgi:hypothetical protein
MFGLFSQCIVNRSRGNDLLLLARCPLRTCSSWHCRKYILPSVDSEHFLALNFREKKMRSRIYITFFPRFAKLKVWRHVTFQEKQVGRHVTKDMTIMLKQGWTSNQGLNCKVQQSWCHVDVTFLGRHIPGLWCLSRRPKWSKRGWTLCQGTVSNLYG